MQEQEADRKFAWRCESTRTRADLSALTAGYNRGATGYTAAECRPSAPAGPDRIAGCATRRAQAASAPLRWREAVHRTAQEPVMNVSTAHAIVYLNDDGSYTLPSLHTTRDCAIDSISVLEGRLVAGIAQVQMLPGTLSGMQLRLRHTAPKTLAVSA